MKQQNKSGGNVQKNVSDLLVPFGLMLAKESLETFLKKQKKTQSASQSPKLSKKVSLSGGGKSSNKIEAFNSKPRFASVTGGSGASNGKPKNIAATSTATSTAKSTAKITGQNKNKRNNK